MEGDVRVTATLWEFYAEQSARLHDQPFLWRKPAADKPFEALTWSEVTAEIERISAGFAGLGIRKGDRIAIVAENRPEWFVADLAAMRLGAISVPTYTTNTEEDHLHILRDSGAKLAVVSTLALGRRVAAAARRLDWPLAIIATDDWRLDPGDIPVLPWAELGIGAAVPPVAAVLPDDVACLIYTSGTGGVPKGVMQTHRNILSNCQGSRGLISRLGDTRERFLSFLPLSHSYEHTAGQYVPIGCGAEIFYAESIERLALNLREAQPTIVVAVPRLYEVMRGRMEQGLKRKGRFSRHLFHRALALGGRRFGGPPLSLLERLENRVLDLLVRRKVKAGFGGRLKAFVSGGAALEPELGRFFHALGIRLLQGYGQTEAGPVVSCNVPGKERLETVGPPLPGIEARIAEDGEILLRGDCVMKGYWNLPEATAQAIDGDGWLHTGDVGVVEADGHLRITDRKKDIIVLSGGDNISPARVENQLCLEPEIAQAMVHGDRRPHLVALLVPAQDLVERIARELGREPDLAQLRREPALMAALNAALERVNRRLSSLERVRRFAIPPAPFSVDNRQMTPTLKVRRHEVRAAHGDVIEALYGER